MLSFVVGGASIVSALCAIRWAISRPISHISTGVKRRKLYPLDSPIGNGAKASLSNDAVSIKRELVTLRDGFQFFLQTVSPTKCAASHVVVFFHGYTSHTDMYLEVMCLLSQRGAVVLLFDLPCHGRSDGTFAYIPSWWSWCNQIWELLDTIVPRARQQGEKPLPVFGMGFSLGGGLATCLAVQRPTFFDGFVVIAPMLMVADEIKPPYIVQQVFRYVLVPLLPAWPITPSKDVGSFDFRVPAQCEAFGACNPICMTGCKPRLATAYALAFDFPGWMEANLSQIKTPFLVLHGKEDKITDPKLSERLFNESQTKADDKDFKLYDTAFHCELICCLPGHEEFIGLKFLPEQRALTERCITDVSTWIASRLT